MSETSDVGPYRSGVDWYSPTANPDEPPDSQVFLNYFLSNTTPVELYRWIGESLKSPMTLPSELNQLHSALQRAGVVTNKATVAVKDTVDRHCVRCHKTYREKDNARVACTIAHCEPDVDINYTGSGDNKVKGVAYYYACCEKYLDICRPENRWHFIGRHTTRTGNVDYTGETEIRTCLTTGCHGGAEMVVDDREL